MASIFEELMTANQRLTESVHPFKKKTESRKINCRHLKVESRKFFEENDLDTLEKEFEVPEVTSENPDEIVLVIDPEIQDSEEIPEDAAEEMVGDLVYKCPVCGSNYVCNCDADKAFEEGIEVDEEGTPIECPICGDDADQILVGEIAPADEAEGKEVDLPPQEEDEDLPDEDGNLDNPIEEDLDISVSTDDEGKVDEVVVDEDGETVVDEVVDEVSENEDPETVEESVDDAAVLEPAVEDAVEDEEESPAVVVKDSNVELFFDEARLESLVRKVLKDNYKGNPSFKVSKVRLNKGVLKVEYVVRRGKSSKKGILVGEGFNTRTRVFEVSFKDKGAFTESFGRTPAFVVEMVRVRNKFIPTKMTYDFKVKVNESLYRVVGKVGHKRTESSLRRRRVNESENNASTVDTIKSQLSRILRDMDVKYLVRDGYLFVKDEEDPYGQDFWHIMFQTYGDEYDMKGPDQPVWLVDGVKFGVEYDEVGGEGYWRVTGIKFDSSDIPEYHDPK